MPTTQIALKRPHSDRQRQIITHPGNVAAFCGRRFGKTDALVQRLFYWMQRRPGLYWWVGLSWRSASLKRAWRETGSIARQVLRGLGLQERSHINRSAYEIRLPGMGEIWFRTADNPSSLAGEGIQGAVLDEFSLMTEAVWVEYIEATLLDYGGWAAFAGVPKGRNWAANLWHGAAGRPGWLQVHATSYDNPFIRAERIDQIRENTAERFFRQEYLAEVIDDAGGVFRRVVEAATAQALTAPLAGRQYVFGVDWGKQNDWTAIAVVDVTAGELVALDRFNRIDYQVQLARLKALAERFRPARIIAERNSMGEPLVEQLQREGLPVDAFTTTNATKATIIEALALAFERSALRIVPEPVLVGELQAYEMQRLPSGSMRYSAPEGMHDDTVMALALAWSGAQRGEVAVMANPFYG